MHAVVRRYTYTGQGMTELVNELGEELRRAMAETPGFQSYSMVVGDGVLATITVCADQAGTEASNRIAASWVRANMPATIQLSTPETTEGEVLLSS